MSLVCFLLSSFPGGTQRQLLIKPKKCLGSVVALDDRIARGSCASSQHLGSAIANLSRGRLASTSLCSPSSPQHSPNPLQSSSSFASLCLCPSLSPVRCLHLCLRLCLSPITVSTACNRQHPTPDRPRLSATFRTCRGHCGRQSPSARGSAACRHWLWAARCSRPPLANSWRTWPEDLRREATLSAVGGTSASPGHETSVTNSLALGGAALFVASP